MDAFPVDRSLVRWNPSRASGVALLTELGMIAAYAVLGANSSNLGVAALVGLVVVPVLAVGIPVYWMLAVERQDIAALGLTARRAWPSLALSLLLSLFVLSPLWFAGRALPAPDLWLPMAAAGAFSLFEPLFVFGWLQSRFERDFGLLPAILLAALGYALYHLGYMPGQMSGQFLSAVLFAVCFRLTGNLLVCWPVLWAAASAWLCLGANVCFYNWGMASFSGIVLALEVVFMIVMVARQHRLTRQAVG